MWELLGIILGAWMVLSLVVGLFLGAVLHRLGGLDE